VFGQAFRGVSVRRWPPLRLLLGEPHDGGTFGQAHNAGGELSASVVAHGGVDVGDEESHEVHFDFSKFTRRLPIVRVGKEDAEGLAVVDHHVEVDAESDGNALSRNLLGRYCVRQLFDQRSPRGSHNFLVQQGLGFEVLVEDWLGEARLTSDVIHGGGLVAVLGEDALGHGQKLGATLDV